MFLQGLDLIVELSRRPRLAESLFGLLGNAFSLPITAARALPHSGQRLQLLPGPIDHRLPRLSISFPFERAGVPNQTEPVGIREGRLQSRDDFPGPLLTDRAGSASDFRPTGRVDLEPVFENPTFFPRWGGTVTNEPHWLWMNRRLSPVQSLLSATQRKSGLSSRRRMVIQVSRWVGLSSVFPSVTLKRTGTAPSALTVRIQPETCVKIS